MKKLIALTILTGSIALSALQAAEVHQPLNIDALGYYQGPSVTNGNSERLTVRTVRITDQTILRAISADAGTSLTGYRLFHDATIGGGTRITARRGSNVVDVSQYFTFSSSNTVEDSLFNTSRNAFNRITTYGIRNLNVSTSTLSLALSGFGTTLGRTVNGRDGTNTVSGVIDVIIASGAGTFSLTSNGQTLSGPARGSFRTSGGL